MFNASKWVTFQFWKNIVTFPPYTVTFPWYFYKTTSRIKTTKNAWAFFYPDGVSLRLLLVSSMQAFACTIFKIGFSVICKTHSVSSHVFCSYSTCSRFQFIEFTNNMANTVQCHFPSFPIGSMEDVSKK